MENEPTKGLWEQMHESHKTVVSFSADDFSKEDFLQFFRDLESQPPGKYIINLPCHEYSSFSDEAFIEFIKMYEGDEYFDVRFTGGREGFTKMKERMKRLNLE